MTGTAGLPLFDQADGARNKLEAKYREWIAANPRVLDLFRTFARQMLVRQRRFGAKALAERVRWEVRATWDRDGQGFRINNNFTAYIARDLIREMPGLAALLETRRVDGEETA